MWQWKLRYLYIVLHFMIYINSYAYEDAKPVNNRFLLFQILQTNSYLKLCFKNVD